MPRHVAPTPKIKCIIPNESCCFLPKCNLASGGASSQLAVRLRFLGFLNFWRTFGVSLMVEYTFAL